MVSQDKSSEKPGKPLSSFREGKWQKSQQHDACMLRRRVRVFLVLASFSPRKYGRNGQRGLIGSINDAWYLDGVQDSCRSGLHCMAAFYGLTWYWEPRVWARDANAQCIAFKDWERIIWLERTLTGQQAVTYVRLRVPTLLCTEDRDTAPAR